MTLLGQTLHRPQATCQRKCIVAHRATYDAAMQAFTAQCARWLSPYDLIEERVELGATVRIHLFDKCHLTSQM